MHLPGHLRSTATQKTYILLFILVVLTTFWRCIFLPFISDDWGWLEAFYQHESFSLIFYFFNPKINFFYRPVAQTYFFLMYKIFGDNPLPFHILALLIHMFNSLFVAAIFSYLTKDRLIGTLTGLIYAVASIHLDTLLWAVGIYDLGAAFFFFMSIWLFIQERHWSSVASFLMATLFKESIVILPLILAGLTFFRNQKILLYDLRTVLKILPYMAISVLVFGIKILADLFSTTLPSSHPYAFRLLGVHVGFNLYSYLTWMSQSFIPFDNELPIFGFFIIILMAVKFKIAQKWEKRSDSFLVPLLISWVFSCLLPILFLPNHTYGYYAIYALPALICGILIILRGILISFNINPLKIRKVLSFFGIFVICFSIIQNNLVLGQGLRYKTFLDETSILVRRAAYVDITRSFLLHYLPVCPDNAALVFDDVDIEAFNKDSGPRVWYRNNTLHVYELRNLRYGSSGWYIENTMENQAEGYAGPSQKRIYVDPAKLYVFRLTENEMHLIPHEVLKVIAASTSDIAPEIVGQGDQSTR